MRRIVILLCMISFLVIPVSAMDFTAPEAPNEAQKLMPREIDNFGEGLRFIAMEALEILHPSITEALRIGASVVATVLLIGVLSEFCGNARTSINMAGTIAVGIMLFKPLNSLIRLGTDTVAQISDYGKLLLPVMTGALAAQGAVTKSGALYTATAFFNAFLSSAVADFLVPIVYVYLSTSIICGIFEQPFLKSIKDCLKWFLTWGLKTVLYIFTGYISITGIVGGSTDATILKATKLSISGMVPVVGNILSDASEAVLVSAGIMKNAAGIYGLLTIIALWIGPFIRIRVQYILLKITSGLSEMLGSKEMAGIIKDFSTTMGLVLALTGAVCLIFLICTICFLKGVS